uniref:uncharacterized protein LOC109974794 n=1 Tax=Monopterus albus TaxID=43700 RepID=UPI0009B3F53B|nr:uncharacterized protein LOC109974794 [Monopterus albus]
MIAEDMKVLVVFLLVMLSCSLAEGRLYSKCSLRTKIMQALAKQPAQLKQNGLTGEDFVAKLVCHAEVSAGFDTSALETKPMMRNPHTVYNVSNSAHLLKGEDSPNPPTTNSTPSQNQSGQYLPTEESLHGIFQLSDGVTCVNGSCSNYSLNLCGTNCSKFLDSNINDDLGCVMKIFNTVVNLHTQNVTATPQDPKKKPSVPPEYQALTQMNAKQAAERRYTDVLHGCNLTEEFISSKAAKSGSARQASPSGDSKRSGSADCIYVTPLRVQTQTVVAVNMKVLVVFVLAVLGCSLTEGQLNLKCNLKEHLTTAMNNFKDIPNEMSKENLVVQLICHAEVCSGFNTSAMRMVVNRAKKGMPLESQAWLHRSKWSTIIAWIVGLSQPSQDEVHTLYGPLQLSNRVACSDGVTPSPNICKLPCSKLCDDDPKDDVMCLMKFLEKPGFLNVLSMLKPSCREEWRLKLFMLGLLQHNECKDKQASSYFAEC